MYASLLGNLPMAEVLVQAGSSVNLSQRDTGNTPLHFAVFHDYTCIAHFLISNGAISVPNAEGLIPFDKANSLPMKELLRGKNTSVTHPFQVNFVDNTHLPVLQNSAIGMSMCPGRNNHKNWSRDFDTDLEVLLAHEVQLVVTLMTKTELQKMNLWNMSDRLAAVDVEWIHYPIADKWLPQSNDDFVTFITVLVDKIQAEKKIVVHCNGGKGRTGLTVVACLIKLGVTQIDAISKIRNVRSGMLQNPAQQMYLSMLEKKLTAPDKGPDKAFPSEKVPDEFTPLTLAELKKKQLAQSGTDVHRIKKKYSIGKLKSYSFEGLKSLDFFKAKKNQPSS
jgi:protein-tyrosine phosphatase